MIGNHIRSRTCFFPCSCQCSGFGCCCSYCRHLCIRARPWCIFLFISVHLCLSLCSFRSSTLCFSNPSSLNCRMLRRILLFPSTCLCPAYLFLSSFQCSRAARCRDLALISVRTHHFLHMASPSRCCILVVVHDCRIRISNLGI